MAICKTCGQEVAGKKLLKHRWDNHREEMMEQSRRARLGKKLQKTGTGNEPKLVVDQTANSVQADKEIYQLKGRFITKEIDLPGDLLVLYWLARSAFPEYDANEGQWISDCITQFYAEHSEELGFNKLFDKTFEVVRA